MTHPYASFTTFDGGFAVTAGWTVDVPGCESARSPVVVGGATGTNCDLPALPAGADRFFVPFFRPWSTWIWSGVAGVITGDMRFNSTLNKADITIEITAATTAETTTALGMSERSSDLVLALRTIDGGDMAGGRNDASSEGIGGG